MGEKIKREVAPKIPGPTGLPGGRGGPHKRPSPETSQGLGYLSFLQLLIPEAGVGAKHRHPAPSPISRSAPGFRRLPELFTPDDPGSTGPSPAPLGGDREGQGPRTVGCPCGLSCPGPRPDPSPHPVAPPRGRGSGRAKRLQERMGGQGPRQPEG